ncbi:MAG: hypothetical protein ABJN34_03550 [Litoreibacter sp.]|uniref:hypothetical protein n=1 Tax=Litoreibacter sp. TaxID=1969459 RepID=UPI0032998B76
MAGGAQIKSLLWLDEKETARTRTLTQSQKLQELAFMMPKDVLTARLTGGADSANVISNIASELRHRPASVPSLASRLLQLEVHGRDYLKVAQEEDKQPFLVLPA